MFARLFLLSVLLAVPLAAQRRLAPEEVRTLLGQMATRFETVRDYTCVMARQERIGNTMHAEGGIEVRFLKPLALHLRWTRESRGKEALFARGINGDQVLARTGGFLGGIVLKLDPTGALAMKGNRHPITEACIGHFIEVITRETTRALGRQEGMILDQGTVRLGDRSATRYRATFPSGYYAASIDVDLDDQLQLPVRIEARDAQGELMETYHFTEIRLNSGLTDKAFVPGQPECRFGAP